MIGDCNDKKIKNAVMLHSYFYQEYYSDKEEESAPSYSLNNFILPKKKRLCSTLNFFKNYLTICNQITKHELYVNVETYVNIRCLMVSTN